MPVRAHAMVGGKRRRIMSFALRLATVMAGYFLLGFSLAADAQPSAVPPGPPRLIDDTIERPAAALRVHMEIYALPYAPGRTIAALPGHRHPGHVYVYVLEGHVVSSLDGAPATTYGPGQTWQERPGQLHRILNPEAGSVARILVTMVDPVA